MGSLFSDLSGYASEISAVGGELGPILVKSLVLLVLVLYLVKYLGRFLAVVLTKAGVPERRAAFSVTILHITVLLVGALVILSMVGFPGAFLFRVVMVIVLLVVAVYIIVKPYIPALPFKTGDVVKIGDTMGIADSITIMHTRIRAFDGKVTSIPNQKVLNSQVTNSSIRPNRRLDINFFIPYDQDVDQVKEVVSQILAEDDIVLEEPFPRVVIDQFAPGYMEMKARFWVERRYGLTGRWGLNEKIKLRFEEEGISMASPRLEVSLAGRENIDIS